MTFIDDSNDSELFAELYYSHRTLLYNIAFNILKDKGRSEDAVHEAYLSLSQNMKKISDKSCIQMLNYLIIIVRNAALRIYNKNKRECPVENVNSSLIDVKDIAIYVEGKDYNERMIRILKSMDQKYADVLILKYTYNMKNKDIADSLGITPDNVKVRLSRGKKMLKKLLEEVDLK